MTGEFSLNRLRRAIQKNLFNLANRMAKILYSVKRTLNAPESQVSLKDDAP